jgi:hypothetical protein
MENPIDRSLVALALIAGFCGFLCVISLEHELSIGFFRSLVLHERSHLGAFAIVC